MCVFGCVCVWLCVVCITNIYIDRGRCEGDDEEGGRLALFARCLHLPLIAMTTCIFFGLLEICHHLCLMNTKYVLITRPQTKTYDSSNESCERTCKALRSCEGGAQMVWPGALVCVCVCVCCQVLLRARSQPFLKPTLSRKTSYCYVLKS